MAHRALTLKYRPAGVRRPGRPGPRERGAGARAREQARRARLPVHRCARRGQDRPARASSPRRSTASAARSGELKGADPCNECTSCTEITKRRVARRRRRSTAPRTAASPTSRRCARRCASRRPAGSYRVVDHRRGAPALERRVRRAAQDARGAAAAPGVHLRHHRSAEAARHDPLAHASASTSRACRCARWPTACSTIATREASRPGRRASSRSPRARRC